MAKSAKKKTAPSATPNPLLSAVLEKAAAWEASTATRSEMIKKWAANTEGAQNQTAPGLAETHPDYRRMRLHIAHLCTQYGVDFDLETYEKTTRGCADPDDLYDSETHAWLTLAAILEIEHAAKMSMPTLYAEITRKEKSPAEGAAVEMTSKIMPNNEANEDFSWVRWNGTEYNFATTQQKAAVKALWKTTGNTLHTSAIREAVESRADRFDVGKIFKNHPAWGEMIVRVGKGTVRLKKA